MKSPQPIFYGRGLVMESLTPFLGTRPNIDYQFKEKCDNIFINVKITLYLCNNLKCAFKKVILGVSD